MVLLYRGYKYKWHFTGNHQRSLGPCFDHSAHRYLRAGVQCRLDGHTHCRVLCTPRGQNCFRLLYVDQRLGGQGLQGNSGDLWRCLPTLWQAPPKGQSTSPMTIHNGRDPGYNRSETQISAGQQNRAVRGPSCNTSFRQLAALFQRWGDQRPKDLQVFEMEVTSPQAIHYCWTSGEPDDRADVAPHREGVGPDPSGRGGSLWFAVHPHWRQRSPGV